MFSESLSEFLRAKIPTCGMSGLRAVQDTLCDELGVESIQLLDAAGKPIHGRTLFRRALEQAGSVDVRVPMQPATGNGSSDRDPDRTPTPEPSEGPAQSDPPSQVRVPERPNTANVEFNQTFLIREFFRREQQGKVMVAGFLVNDLLPRLGFTTTQAKQILRQIEAQGIVRTQTVPSTKNPDRMTTLVELNHNHPGVREFLAGEGAEAFRPIPIRGEPASETLIRDRR